MTIGNEAPLRIPPLDAEDSTRLKRVAAAVADIAKKIEEQRAEINEVYAEMVLLRKEFRALSKGEDR